MQLPCHQLNTLQPTTTTSDDQTFTKAALAASAAVAARDDNITMPSMCMYVVLCTTLRATIACEMNEAELSARAREYACCSSIIYRKLSHHNDGDDDDDDSRAPRLLSARSSLSSGVVVWHCRRRRLGSSRKPTYCTHIHEIVSVCTYYSAVCARRRIA